MDWAVDAAAEPLVTAFVAAVETELLVAALPPAVIVIAPFILKLLPSHVRNPSETPPFKLITLLLPSFLPI